MLHHIQGKLTHSSPTWVVLEANGIGYTLNISLSTYQRLGKIGSLELLLAHLQVSENSQTLYGFKDDAERQLFRALISIKGVGPATAMQILSGTKPEEFAQAVERQDHSALKRIKGIGEKTAKRIIVELQDSASLALLSNSLTTTAGAASENNVEMSARQALETLGITSREAAMRVEKVLRQDREMALEEVIRLALQ